MTAGKPEVRIITSAPVATGAVVWQSRGQLYVSVAVKATFALVHDKPMELCSPAEMFRAEAHHRDNPARSIRATSDLVPYLNRADVVLTGHACAPEGVPTTMVAVRLAIFRETTVLDKSAHVHGDRRKGVPAPFDKIPLVYERAIGGVGWEDNPLGVGMRAGGPSDPTEANLLHPTDPTILTGFGPISRTWPARRRLLGKTDKKTLDKPVVLVPDGFDWDYFQAAPADQQIDFMRGDEWILLEGMHPSMPRISSRLPGARATGSVLIAPGAAPLPLDFRADIVRIDADAQSCSVVWRAAFPVRDEAAIGELTFLVGIEIAGCSIEWSEEISLADEDVLEIRDSMISIDLSDDATLKRSERAPRPEKTTLWTPEMAAELRKPPAELAGKLEGTFAPDDPGRAAGRATLPFTTLGATSKLPAAVLPAAKHEGTMALSPEESDSAAKRPETPFARPQAPRPRAVIAKPIPGAPWAGPQPPPRAKPAKDALTEETLDSELDAAPVPSKPPSLQRPKVAVVTPSTPPSARAAPISFAPSSAPAPATPAAPRPPTPRPAPARSAAVLRALEHVPRRTQDAVPVAGKSPFTVLTMHWQLKAGVDSLAVIVKATCDLGDGGVAQLRAEADPPSGDVHDGGDPSRTLLYPSDFAPFKPRADVLLAGHVYPRRGSTTATQARFSFGHKSNGFERAVAVFGERRWQTAGIKLSPTAPRPFKKVPLVYERAFGGPSFDKNPMGLGQMGDSLPQLEDPASLIQSPSDTPDPVCFAALSPAWPGRRAKLGTFDAEWKKKRWPFFPDDFDWSYFQAAPPAQQLDHLHGDEPYEIAGALAERPLQSGKLPGVRPRCFAQKTSEAGGEFHEVLLRLDTVTFEPDRAVVTLVWRGLLDVQGDDAHDVAELFVFEEGLGSRSADRAEAFSKYRAATLAAAPELAAAEAPANQTTPGGAPSGEVLAPPPPRPPSAEEAAAARARVTALLEAGRSLEGLEVDGAHLDGFDFSGRSLADARLPRARLSRAHFAGANLSGAQLGGADLSGADLSGADLSCADLTGADLTDARLDGADLGGATFAGARADGSSWNETHGDGAVFAGASLKKARFERAALGSADFTRAALDGAVFDGAILAEVRLYDATGTAVSFKGTTLEGARADGVTLRRSVLARAQARSSVWDRAILDESTFLGAVLCEAGFVKASCKGAIFSGADLTAARLRKGSFAGAAFLKANLMTASLEGADLEGADLRGANLHGAETLRANLSGARLELAIVTQTKLAEK